MVTNKGLNAIKNTVKSWVNGGSNRHWDQAQANTSTGSWMEPWVGTITNPNTTYIPTTGQWTPTPYPWTGGTSSGTTTTISGPAYELYRTKFQQVRQALEKRDNIPEMFLDLMVEKILKTLDIWQYMPIYTDRPDSITTTPGTIWVGGNSGGYIYDTSDTTSGSTITYVGGSDITYINSDSLAR